MDEDQKLQWKILEDSGWCLLVFLESLLNIDGVSIEGINRYLIEAPTRLLYTFLVITSSPSGNQ